ETVGAAQPVAFFERLPEGVERRAILALRARSPQSAQPDGGRQRRRDERCPRRLRHSRLACGGHGLSNDRVTMRFRPARRWSVSLGGTVDALRYWNALLGLSRGDAADRGAELAGGVVLLEPGLGGDRVSAQPDARGRDARAVAERFVV